MTKDEFAALFASPPGVSRPQFQSTQDIREIEVSGAMAFMWSALTVAVTLPGATHPIEREGHTLTIFRKVKGRWLLARDANLLTTKSK
jgi:ketosteroid isomerase-like protein